MKLTVYERLQIPALVENKKGDISLQRVLLGLIQKVGLTGEEREKFNLQTVDGNFQFTNALCEIDLDKYEIEIVADVLKEKSDAKDLALNQISLYEKFVEGKTDEVTPEVAEPEVVEGEVIA